MPAVTLAVLASLQANTKNIRNICVLAHVDHGKTSLSDSLIASNGIISGKMAGKLRYLDSRPDEQERGITMKSSSISLLFQKKPDETAAATTSDDTNTNHNYLVNLIDSPGHVSTAVRITDGALVLVDVVEGVCIQTHAVLRQAWLEKVRPTLVLNKIDRLITELHMTPLEAYQHMAKVMEQVNVITGTLFNENVTQTLDKVALSDNQDEVQDEIDDSELYFSPDQGNVAFGCAADGWAFRVDHFAELYSKKLGMKKSILQKTLWGDFYLSMKDKKIYKKPRGNLQPMFVQFVLNNIWEVYNSALQADKPKIDKIVSALKLTVAPRDLASRDNKQVMQAIMQAWLPLSDTILSMVVEKLPDPITAQQIRIEHLFVKQPAAGEELAAKQKTMEKDLLECSKTGEVVVFVSKVVAVPKEVINASKPRMPPPRRIVARQETSTQGTPAAAVASTTTATTTTATTTTATGTQAVEADNKPKDTTENKEPAQKTQTYTDRTGEAFVAFSRIFSGTIRKDQVLHILHPRYDPLHPENFVSEARVDQLYMLMGRSLEPVDEVPAGNVFGIAGDIGSLTLKTATISSTLSCPSFTKMHFVSSPIVRVAIEPTNPMEMPKLVEGLKHLNQADPSVEVLVQDTGEHVIIAAGELHLERCLRDLREIFCKIDLQVSAPIVPFRETIISHTPKSSHIMAQTPNKLVQIKAKAIPIPYHISRFLENNAAEIKLMLKSNKERKSDQNFSAEFKEKFLEELKLSGEVWAREIDNIWTFGPRRVGPNILLNHIPEFANSQYFGSVFAKQGGKRQADVNLTIEAKDVTTHSEELETNKETNASKESDTNKEEEASTKVETSKEPETSEPQETHSDTDSVKSGQSKQRTLVSQEEKFRLLRELDHSIISGFQLATLAGPLCDEPMMGLCCIIEDIIIYKPESPKEVTQNGPLSGQVISTAKEATRLAFQSADMRLLEANYECEVQVSSEALGKVYAVLSKRRAKIIKEGMKEGTPIFSIQAKLPVIESFGFSDQLMKQTSGAANAQLLFENDWAALEQDPYFVPTTEEELEESGTNVASLGTNIARKYMDQVRRRKGLVVEEKVVEHGEKQRTLKKNK